MTVTISRTLQGKLLAFKISLTSEQNGRWYIILLRGAALRGDPLVTLTVENAMQGGASIRRFLPLRFAGKTLAELFMVCVAEDQSMAIVVHGEHTGSDLGVRLIGIPRLVAALVLVCLQPSILLPRRAGKTMRGRGGFRKRLAVAAIRLGPRLSYPAWQRMYDRWQPASGENALLGTTLALVFTNGEQDRMALDATLASLNAASRGLLDTRLRLLIIDRSTSQPADALRAGLDGAAEDFFIVLQAGEVIAPHAITALARYAETRQLPIVYADEDRIDLAGNRSDPVFKPEPSRMLMLSGALATGVFLLRRDALEALKQGPADCADALRLDAWLRLSRLSGGDGKTAFSGRLPLILTHRRPDTAATPPELLAAIARLHLGSAWIGDINAAQLPLRIRPGIASLAPRVSLIVASTARLPHVRRCLAEVLAQTRYPDFEMIIVLAQNAPPDPAQQASLAPILADPRVRVIFAPMEKFNYSKANNVAVKHSAAPLICLLNDDVAPITPDWLSIMVGHLQDEHIAAVGAKLYYPEQTVQHGGVIMGLAGLCDHSFRFLPRGDPGYAARASVEQELSAVTAACMLIRKPVFDAVGGLDENFASAFNDVDLCLKIRDAGYGIIWSAQAELWHHETITFGQHYADEHKPIAKRDIGIMRERWAEWCAVDPYHNPNLSLNAQSEWELAFPPRLGDLPEALGLVVTE